MFSILMALTGGTGGVAGAGGWGMVWALRITTKNNVEMVISIFFMMQFFKQMRNDQ
jgi:hypothetical protein